MSRIVSSFNSKDTIFEVEIEGIPLGRLKKFAEATGDTVKTYQENGTYYVPGIYLVAMFRHVVKKLAKENPDFPMKKLTSFYGGNRGGTKENRVFLNQNLVYGIKYLSKDQYMVEISRLSKKQREIVLQGIFIFLE